MNEDIPIFNMPLNEIEGRVKKYADVLFRMVLDNDPQMLYLYGYRQFISANGNDGFNLFSLHFFTALAEIDS